MPDPLLHPFGFHHFSLSLSNANPNSSPPPPPNPILPQNHGSSNQHHDRIHRGYGVIFREGILTPVPIQAEPVPSLPPPLGRQGRVPSRREARASANGNRRLVRRDRFQRGDVEAGSLSENGGSVGGFR